MLEEPCTSLASGVTVRALGRRAAIDADLPAIHDQLLRVALSAAHLGVRSIQGIRSLVVVKRASVPFADRVTRRAFLVRADGLKLPTMDVLMAFRAARGRVKEIRSRLNLRQ